MGLKVQFKDQVNTLWHKFSQGQKITILIIISLFLIAVICLIFVRQSRMEVLYSGLSPENASALTSKLKEQKVPYQLVDEGRTILVKAEDKYQLRLDMAGEVNLKGVIGFESFSETRFGETDTDKRIKYLVALQGELTRTIEYLDVVDAAKVHIVLPEKSLFIRDQKTTTASVLLRLKAYATLKPEQVKSIMSFVSHSVEGLQAENVTVMDVNGNLLSENLAGNGPGFSVATVSQLALKQQYEKEVANSIQTMLERIVGPGKAVVRASVTMDFDQIETHSEKYEEPFVISEQIREESSSGSSQATGGNPADANMMGSSYGDSGSGKSEYESSETVRNFEAGKIVEKKITAPGKITNLSLSVLIDGDLTPEEESNIRNVIADAAGIDRERGDQVSFVAMPFNVADLSEIEEELAKREAAQRRMEYLKMLKEPLLILLFLGAFFFVIRQVREIALARGQYRAQNIAERGVINDDYPEVDLTLSPEAMEKKAIQKKVDKLVKKEPEEVAKIVKTWLAEDQR